MKNIAYFFITAISIVVILVFGKALLIPFVFAILLWFVIREIRELLDRIPFVKKRFALWAKNLLTSIVILSILGFASGLITSNINALAKAYPKYEANVGHMVEKINEAFDIDVREYINAHSGDIDFGTILKSIFNSLSEIFSSTFMILIYVVFIFLEEALFRPKLANMFADSDRFNRLMEIIKSIETSVAKYLGLKTLVSFITGILGLSHIPVKLHSNHWFAHWHVVSCCFLSLAVWRDLPGIARFIHCRGHSNSSRQRIGAKAHG